MDYGNASQNNDFALDQENLNTEGGNWDNASQSNITPGHDPRVIGSKTISAPETTPEATPEQPTTPELGQITPVMPPGYSEPIPDTTPTTTPSQTPVATSFHRSSIMHGDNLSSKAVDALKNNERELGATGDAAAFFDKITAAREEFQGKEAAA